MIRFDTHKQFVTTEGKALGVYVSLKRGRYQYRDEKGNLYASGMAPAAFVKRFWLRDDFVDEP